jgi:uncharacterized protein
MKIGLISDTHGFLDKKVFHYFQHCNEIWHAGDIGSIEVADHLENFKPLKAVFGNIDGKALRIRYPEHQRFTCEGLKVWMTHIGGTPPRYKPQIRKALLADPPNLFICGHSHILRIISDTSIPGLIYLNPGAAGKQGFHQMRTLVRFEIENAQIKNMQVIELGKRA